MAEADLAEELAFSARAVLAQEVRLQESEAPEETADRRIMGVQGAEDIRGDSEA